VGKIKSKTARLLMSATLRLARYRSYRERNTRALAASLLPAAEKDPVVPDHVLAMPFSEMPRPAGIRALAEGRTIIAISPIAYAKPQKWPSENRTTYERYMAQMARVMSELLDRGYFLVIVCSSLWDDESAIADLLENLDERSKAMLTHQMHMPSIATWRDLVGSLLDVDFLIASRLHSVILGLVAQTPTVAISFEPKVEWVMEDLDQTDYLVRIRDFVAEDVIAALDRISVDRNEVIGHVALSRREILSASAPQYDKLVEFALTSRQSSRLSLTRATQV
jgi:polysaccharide pyruvyl transferase WcaK-like protein